MSTVVEESFGTSTNDVLRVTTYNVLAPVWVNRNYYPGQDYGLFDAATRRQKWAQQVLSLSPDICFLQEVQGSELEEVMNEEGALAKHYEQVFCPFPETFWTNWLTDTTNFEPRKNGVCMLLKRDVIKKIKVSNVPIDLPEWAKTLPVSSLGAHALFVTATLDDAGKGCTALLVVSHLDADSIHRAGLQLARLAELVKDAAATDGVDIVLWGGDFNLVHSNAAMRKITAHEGGFQFASFDNNQPSVFTGACTLRVDHVLTYIVPQEHRKRTACLLSPRGTYVPRCPLGHTFAVLPFADELRNLMGYLTGEHGQAFKYLVLICALVLFPFVLVLATPYYYLKVCEAAVLRKRQAWALAEWGSDHLPVTVALQLHRYSTQLKQRSPRRNRSPWNESLRRSYSDS